MRNFRIFQKRMRNFARPIMAVALFLVGTSTNVLFAQNWDQLIKTTASDRGSGDFFGFSVAISGEYAIVGAYRADEDVTGNNYLSNAGAVYIFKNVAGTWTETQKIVASDRGADDKFGYSVSISGDYAIVGAFEEDEDAVGGNTVDRAGAAYIFRIVGGVWSEIQKIVASDRSAYDEFGYSVAISGDYAIVGAYREDEDAAGGNTLSDPGSVYIYVNNSGTWSEAQKITASDRADYDSFGKSVAIAGDYAIVGNMYDDEDELGGNTILGSGSAYILKNNAGTWSEVQKIVASDRGAGDVFGSSVAISGDHAIVGAYGDKDDATGGNSLSYAGSAYIFENSTGVWLETQKIVPSEREADDEFGISVAISGDYAIVGAYQEDEDTAGGNTISDAGSAYVFKKNTGSWTEVQKIIALDRGEEDNFGCAVAISGDYALVGAYNEDEDASGGNTVSSAGSAYIFKNNFGAGVVENGFGKSLFIYPNPTSEKFSIDLGANFQNVQITITNIYGQLIDSKILTPSQILNLTIKEPAGIYILSVQAGEKKTVVRLVKE